MQRSAVHNHRPGRGIAAFNIADDEATIQGAMAHLSNYGINIGRGELRAMLDGLALDSIDAGQAAITTPSIPNLIQFLQAWLPGFVPIATAPRKIDQLVGITTVGSWEDEEVVQGVIERTGEAVPYTDWGNVPLSNWNANFERRTIVRFEHGFAVGRLEEARSARMKISTAAEKRNASMLALDIARNRVGFYGFNNGANRTYGFLNDPALPAYVSVTGGTWATKNFLAITADIRVAIAALRAKSQGLFDPETTPFVIALPVAVVDFLSVTSDFGNSVRQWLTETYPKARVETAPELDLANGGANVMYVYAETADDGGSDNNRVFDQLVPAKLQTLGVENRSKQYVEDFANATAGVLLKRPYLVVRYTGL